MADAFKEKTNPRRGLRKIKVPEKYRDFYEENALRRGKYFSNPALLEDLQVDSEDAEVQAETPKGEEDDLDVRSQGSSRQEQFSEGGDLGAHPTGDEPTAEDNEDRTDMAHHPTEENVEDLENFLDCADDIVRRHEKNIQRQKHTIEMESLKKALAWEEEIEILRFRMEEQKRLDMKKKRLEREKEKLEEEMANLYDASESSRRTREWVITQPTNTSNLRSKASRKTSSNVRKGNGSERTRRDKVSVRGGTKDEDARTGERDYEGDVEFRPRKLGKAVRPITSRSASPDYRLETWPHRPREDTLFDDLSIVGLSKDPYEDNQSSDAESVLTEQSNVKGGDSVSKRSAGASIGKSSSKASKGENAPTKPDVNPRITHKKMLTARLAKEVIPLPNFKSGKALDYLEFKEGWHETQLVMDIADDKLKHRMLQEHLGGAPLERVKNFAGTDTAYEDSLRDLDENYGSPRAIYQEVLKPLRDMNAFGELDYKALQQYGKALNNARRAFQIGCGLDHYLLSDLVLADEVAKKLPETRYRELLRYVKSLGVEPKDEMNLNHIIEWWKLDMREMGHLREHITACKTQPKKVDTAVDKKSKGAIPKTGTGVYATNAVKTETKENQNQSSPTTEKSSTCNEERPTVDASQYTCIFCNKKGHPYYKCFAFAKADLDKKIKWYQSKPRCPKCALNHSVSDCKMDRTCPKCEYKHYVSLHDIVTKLAADNAIKLYSTKSKHVTPAERPKDVLMKVVKATVHGPLGSEECHVLLDDGAERSLLLHSVAARLGINGPSEVLRVETVAQQPISISRSYSENGHIYKGYPDCPTAT